MYEMTRMLLRSILMSIALATSSFSPSAVAEEITAEGLVAKVPRLAAENEELDSFYFTAQVFTPWGFLANVEAGWTKADGFGFVLADDSQNPVVYIAGKESLLYDFSTGTIMLTKDAKPNLVIESDGTQTKSGIGVYRGKEKAPFNVDLPSLLKNVRPDPELRRISASIYEVVLISASGKSKIVARFNVAEKWPLQSLVLRRIEGDTLLMAFRDISVGRPLPERLTKFPAEVELPQGATIERIVDSPEDARENGAAHLLHMMRSLSAPGAMREPKLRELPMWKDVDWNEAIVRHQILGPQLSQLLELPTMDQFLADSNPPVAK